MSQKELLEMVLHYAEKSIGPPLNKDGGVLVCSLYSRNDLSLYFNGKIKGRDRDIFEHHAKHCDICMYGLSQIKEEIENKRLTNAALEYMKKHKPGGSFSNILQIAAVWKGKFSWLTSIAGGEVLKSAAVGLTRSRARKAEIETVGVDQPTKLSKQIDDVGISVEVEIKTVDKGRAFCLDFSFFDTNSQSFADGLALQLTGEDSGQEITNEDGRASFKLYHKGIYDVFVTRNRKVHLLHFNLQLFDKD